MEVHHHPNIEKKNFKEYFLEFLMIFLAVTLGFFAENIRENVVEKSREKEYMREMVNNLKYDTVRCNKNTAANTFLLNGLDSLRDEIKNALAGNINGSRLYYFTMKYGNHLGRAAFNKSAITELKSSGSQRLISDRKLVAQISDYYDRRISAAENALPSDLAVKLNNIDDELFNLLRFDDFIMARGKDSIFHSIYNYNRILDMKPGLLLLHSDTEHLQRLYNTVAEFEVAVNNYLFYLAFVKEGAVALISFINKNYTINDE
jgi:hypothetical protein